MCEVITNKHYLNQTSSESGFPEPERGLRSRLGEASFPLLFLDLIFRESLSRLDDLLFFLSGLSAVRSKLDRLSKLDFLSVGTKYWKATIMILTVRKHLFGVLYKVKISNQSSQLKWLEI